MKLSTTTFILIFALLLTACVSSLNPLYTELDLTFDPALIGVWSDSETDETWSLSRAGNLEYKLVHTDEAGRKGEFSARLVKVSDALFLDIAPVKLCSTQNDFYKSHYFAKHSFVRVLREGSAVKISYLEPTWLKDYLAENPDAIRYETIAGEIMLTSQPKDTQKFLLSHLNTRGAFSQPTELIRKRGAQ